MDVDWFWCGFDLFGLYCFCAAWVNWLIVLICMRFNGLLCIVFCLVSLFALCCWIAVDGFTITWWLLSVGLECF